MRKLLTALVGVFYLNTAFCNEPYRCYLSNKLLLITNVIKNGVVTIDDDKDKYVIYEEFENRFSAKGKLGKLSCVKEKNLTKKNKLAEKNRNTDDIISLEGYKKFNDFLDIFSTKKESFEKQADYAERLQRKLENLISKNIVDLKVVVDVKPSYYDSESESWSIPLFPRFSHDVLGDKFNEIKTIDKNFQIEKLNSFFENENVGFYKTYSETPVVTKTAIGKIMSSKNYFYLIKVSEKLSELGIYEKNGNIFLRVSMPINEAKLVSESSKVEISLRPDFPYIGLKNDQINPSGFAQLYNFFTGKNEKTDISLLDINTRYLICNISRIDFVNLDNKKSKIIYPDDVGDKRSLSGQEELLIGKWREDFVEKNKDSDSETVLNIQGITNYLHGGKSNFDGELSLTIKSINDADDIFIISYKIDSIGAWAIINGNLSEETFQSNGKLKSLSIDWKDVDINSLNKDDSQRYQSMINKLLKKNNKTFSKIVSLTPIQLEIKSESGINIRSYKISSKPQ